MDPSGEPLSLGRQGEALCGCALAPCPLSPPFWLSRSQLDADGKVGALVGGAVSFASEGQRLSRTSRDSLRAIAVEVSEETHGVEAGSKGHPLTSPAALRTQPAALRIQPAALRTQPAATRIPPAATRIQPCSPAPGQARRRPTAASLTRTTSSRRTSTRRWPRTTWCSSTSTRRGAPTASSSTRSGATSAGGSRPSSAAPRSKRAGLAAAALAAFRLEAVLPLARGGRLGSGAELRPLGPLEPRSIALERGIAVLARSEAPAPDSRRALDL